MVQTDANKLHDFYVEVGAMDHPRRARQSSRHPFAELQRWPPPLLGERPTRSGG